MLNFAEYLKRLGINSWNLEINCNSTSANDQQHHMLALVNETFTRTFSFIFTGRSESH